MHMYICVCRCRRATVDKQLWGGLAYKDGPELTPETVIRQSSADDVCGDVYVCICMRNTCFDEICSVPWSHVLVVGSSAPLGSLLGA